MTSLVLHAAPIGLFAFGISLAFYMTTQVGRYAYKTLHVQCSSEQYGLLYNKRTLLLYADCRRILQSKAPNS